MPDSVMTLFRSALITRATLCDDHLEIAFDDGRSICIVDDGQMCCEHRYITCDDDVQDLIGHRLVGIEEKPGPTLTSEDGDPHETMFVDVRTDGGFIQITTHNEHNGGYDGFTLRIEENTGRGGPRRLLCIGA